MCVMYDENGKEQGTCYSNGHGGCIEGKDEEIVCYETGTCIIFKDGVKMDACQANAEGTGCKEELKEDITFAVVDCYGGTTQCLNVYKNGQQIDTCVPASSNSSCFEKYGWSGKLKMIFNEKCYGVYTYDAGVLINEEYSKGCTNG